MAGDLRIDPEELSLVGASEYLDAHPDFREAEPRIYVKFRPGGTETSYLGLLDTGAHYCILAREIVHSIEDHLTECIGRRTYVLALPRPALPVGGDSALLPEPKSSLKGSWCIVLPMAGDLRIDPGIG